MAKSIRILVVDDEPGYHDLFTYILEPAGMKVTCVSSGEQALRKSAERSYDLIFMDFHMPILSGLETLIKIKAKRPNQRIVMISSRFERDGDLEKQAEKEGAFAFLFKPVELGDIQALLKRALGPDAVK